MDYLTDNTAIIGLNPKVDELITPLHTIQEKFFNLGMRFVTILDGAGIEDGKVKELLPISRKEAYSVGLLISTWNDDGDGCINSCVGNFMGLLAKNPVQVSPASGELGALKYDNPRFTDGSLTRDHSSPTFDILGEGQYLFIRNRLSLSGYYYNDMATCDDGAKSLSTVANNRVLNKVCDFVQRYFTTLIQTNIPTSSGGSLDNNWVAEKRSIFFQLYINSMISNKEVQSVNLSIKSDGNFNSTKSIIIDVTILTISALEKINATVEIVSE